MDIFSDWDERSAVRSRRRQIFRDEIDGGKQLFTPELVPYLGHPLVQERLNGSDAEYHRVLTRHLYQYLYFTINFEVKVVNRVTHLIATDPLTHSIPAESRLAALKIYTDEGYHALFSLDLISQIEQATETRALPYTFDPFLTMVDRTVDTAIPGNSMLGRILQVVVFETVVTALLDDLPRDPNLASAVRETIADHAHDERSHHAFFARLFLDMWSGFPTSLKAQVALALPSLIVKSLSPYLQPVADILASLGLESDKVAAVLRDTYDQSSVLVSIRRSARHTVKLFEKAGVFKVPGATEAFVAAGLITP